MNKHGILRRFFLKSAGAGAVSIALPVIGNASEKNETKSSKTGLENKPDLPRVLIIGDSISIGYTYMTRELLAGKANVHRPTVNCGPTTRGLEQVDRWLGEWKWDVIHFNFGLHDLKYMNERGALTSPETGKQQVPVDQYGKNLEKLVSRFKQTGAIIIWASTTPVPDGSNGRIKGDAAKYNAAALGVMQKHNILINDLYSFALPQLKEIQLPENVHFTHSGSNILAGQVAASILTALERSY